MKRSPPLQLWLAAATVLFAAGCATAGRSSTQLPPQAELISIDEPLIITATVPPEADLSSKNDEELFALGTAAFSAGQFSRAAACFARLSDVFPRSKHRPAALFNAGLAYENLGDWARGAERFQSLYQDFTGPDANDARFKAAECFYHLGDLKAAHSLLDWLAHDKGLDHSIQIKALVQRGIIELESNDPALAERSLRLAMSLYQEAQLSERLDDYYPAQGQFYLGEVYRTYFSAVKLDPRTSDEKQLQTQLEYKAQLLLSAQGHYLRAVRLGNPDWTVAAGYRIGELYDGLYTELIDSPLPLGLSQEEQVAYREEMRGRVRVLVTKAISIYEQTLSTAERVHSVDNRFLTQAQAALEKMKRVLVEETGPEKKPEPPSPPSQSGPLAPRAARLNSSSLVSVAKNG